MAILNSISRRLRVDPDNLLSRVIHDFIERSGNHDDDAIWDFVGSGTTELHYWSKRHTREMVVSEL